MPDFPAFCRRSNVEELYSDDSIDIGRDDDVVRLTAWTPWIPRYTELAHQFSVAAISIHNAGEPLDYLDALRNVNSINLICAKAIDLTPLQRMTQLTSVALRWKAKQEPSLDFKRLSRLTECLVTYRNGFESIFSCSQLKILRISQGTSISTIDLTSLSNLIELDIEACPKACNILMADSCQLIALKIGTSSKLKLDLRRIGRDLQYLALTGVPPFLLNELTQFQNLRYLMLNQVGRLPLLTYLKNLTKLEAIDAILVGPKELGENAAIIRAINEAGGRGPVLSSAQFPSLA